MNAGKLCRQTGAVIAAFLLFIFLSIIFIPDTAILSALNRGLAGQGLTLSAASFTKAFPLGIRGKGWTISSAKGKLVHFDQARIGLSLLPLLTGKLLITADAGIGAGKISTAAVIAGSGPSTLEIRDLNLEQVPFFPTVTGARAAGILNSRAEVSGTGQKTAGYLKLEARGVELQGVTLGETPLPDAAYHTVQGMFNISGGIARIESFSLQGDGLYVRLKGNIPATSPLTAAPLDLTLELMPKAEFLEKQKFVFLLLAKYLDSPGHYQLPIKGTLAKPLPG